MPDFDIDNLKKQWQEQPVPDKYNNSEILKMLNSKSRNYVKYIFWISVAEFLLFLVMNIFYVFQKGGDDSFMHIMEKLGVEKTTKFEADYAHLYFIMRVVSLLVTGFFVVKFYLNYRQIHVEENLKKFILQIMKFRKTVSLFILTNILLLVFFMAILTMFVLNTISSQNLQMDHPTFIGFLVGLGISTAISIFLIWLYYRVVYGIIMGRLGKNLEQLREIEENGEEKL
ncbi:beta-carotene 15,15'-monooxygenase [Chryseobacterium taklimakanense]|uniref:beta-carotene 15,15'-monooxygenase n=1 Tax=Chryseobacterium taklimakanense TaxID=536441 RepID=UPI000F5D6568|nr:beta-carotene 15,15'-monooxygenase [Chryseobacterium taklimakanense]AZI23335.1 beta-carotene 15,15'-monooxygenase [Chryseobacterium taklimakanense]